MPEAAIQHYEKLKLTKFTRIDEDEVPRYLLQGYQLPLQGTVQPDILHLHGKTSPKILLSQILCPFNPASRALRPAAGAKPAYSYYFTDFERYLT